MRRISYGLLLTAIFVSPVWAQPSATDTQTPAQFATSAGIAIADHLNDLPGDAAQVQNEGSGAIMARKCSQTFAKRADLRPICMQAAINEDAANFAKTRQSANDEGSNPDSKSNSVSSKDQDLVENGKVL